jgi:hypothetical protein
VAIVDKKGRLFGLINLLDLVIIIAIVAVAGRFGYKAIMKNRVAAEGTSQKVQVTFALQAVKDPTIKGAQPGMEVYDRKSGTLIGTIVAVKDQPAVVVGPDGEFQSKYAFDHFITVEGNGRVTSNGTTVSNLVMKNGMGYLLETPGWSGNATVWQTPELPAPQK